MRDFGFCRPKHAGWPVHSRRFRGTGFTVCFETFEISMTGAAAYVWSRNDFELRTGAFGRNEMLCTLVLYAAAVRRAARGVRDSVSKGGGVGRDRYAARENERLQARREGDKNERESEWNYKRPYCRRPVGSWPPVVGWLLWRLKTFVPAKLSRARYN